MTTRKYYPEVDARGRILPEVADGRGVGGRSGLGASRDREFARLGRILEATRDLEGLEALNNLRELVQIPMESGAAARGATAFGPGQVDYLTLPDLRGNQGARSGGIGSLDWRQFGEGGQQDTRNPFGVGRLGLLADGPKGGSDPRDSTVIVRHGDVYFLVPRTSGGEPQQPRGPDAGVDAGADAGVDAGHDAGVDAGPDAGVDAGDEADELDTPLEEIITPENEIRTHPDGSPVRPEDMWRFFRDPRTGVVHPVNRDLVPWARDRGVTPANPDEAAGPDYTGISARLRVPSNWSPRKVFNSAQVRPASGDDGGRPLPRIWVGGLADEPRRRLSRGADGPLLPARSIGPGGNPGPRWRK